MADPALTRDWRNFRADLGDLEATWCPAWCALSCKAASPRRNVLGSASPCSLSSSKALVTRRKARGGKIWMTTKTGAEQQSKQASNRSLVQNAKALPYCPEQSNRRKMERIVDWSRKFNNRIRFHRTMLIPAGGWYTLTRLTPKKPNL